MRLRTLIALAVYSIIAAAVLSSCFEKPAPEKKPEKKSESAPKKATTKNRPVVIAEHGCDHHHHHHHSHRNDPFTMHGPSEDCED